MNFALIDLMGTQSSGYTSDCEVQIINIVRNGQAYKQYMVECYWCLKSPVLTSCRVAAAEKER